MLKIVVVFGVIFLEPLIHCMDHLEVVYEWKQLDFEFASQKAREEAIASGSFIPENNLPLGLEVYKDRLFLTVPRWKNGVASSLNYINLTTASKDSPKLHPYPNWEAHNLENGRQAGIVSPFRVRADRCGRLWFVDSGLDDLLDNTKAYSPARLQVYDLQNDALLRVYELPTEQVKENSFFANIAVDDSGDCEDAYVYLSDLGQPGLLVYSWKKNHSWRIHHHYFHLDPLQGEFSIAGLDFQWTDHVFGIALSKPDNSTRDDDSSYSTLYFHPMTSTSEFKVNTRYLRDEELAMNTSTELYRKFQYLGSRGPRGQSSISFLDQRTDVLFYSLVNLNAIACWRTTNPAYTMESQGRVYMNNVTMVFPNDIKVDPDDNLWVLSDRLPVFMYSKLNYSDVNFRVLMAPVADAIHGTACDSKLVVRSNAAGKVKPTIVRDVSGHRQQHQHQHSTMNGGIQNSPIFSLFFFMFFTGFLPIFRFTL